MSITIREIGPFVHCTYAEQNGHDPLTFMNVFDGVGFCNYCGETDHEVVTA